MRRQKGPGRNLICKPDKPTGRDVIQRVLIRRKEVKNYVANGGTGEMDKKKLEGNRRGRKKPQIGENSEDVLGESESGPGNRSKKKGGTKKTNGQRQSRHIAHWASILPTRVLRRQSNKGREKGYAEDQRNWGGTEPGPGGDIRNDSIARPPRRTGERPIWIRGPRRVWQDPLKNKQSQNC